MPCYVLLFVPFETLILLGQTFVERRIQKSTVRLIRHLRGDLRVNAVALYTEARSKRMEERRHRATGSIRGGVFLELGGLWGRRR
jgi:hypothetical protein